MDSSKDVPDDRVRRNEFFMEKEDLKGELEKIVRRIFPSYQWTCDQRGGQPYFYLPNVELTPEEEKARANRDAAEEQLREDPSSENVKMAKNILDKEYKFHLMPQDRYVLDITEDILIMMREDPQLLSCISDIKIKMFGVDYDNEGNIFPTIVIYPTTGKRDAQHVLDELYAKLHQYQGFGEGLTPRFSKKVDNLIYYAQGGGDLKRNIRAFLEDANEGHALHTMYDSDYVHFNKRGAKLSIPPESKKEYPAGLQNSRRAKIAAVLNKRISRIMRKRKGR